jgi:hypothetical protein
MWSISSGTALKVPGAQGTRRSLQAALLDFRPAAAGARVVAADVVIGALVASPASTEVAGSAGIAVIIPYYRKDPGILREVVLSASAQEGLSDLEIIVVDHGSPAPARDDLRACCFLLGRAALLAILSRVPLLVMVRAVGIS